ALRSSGRHTQMNTRLRGDQLRLQCARRGVNFSELARLARLRRETISKAAAGRSVSEKTLNAIAYALGRVPEIPLPDLAPHERSSTAPQSAELSANTSRHIDESAARA